MMTESQKTKLAEYNSAKSSCPARDRLAALYDDGAFTEVGSGVKTGVVTAYGYIGGCPAYAFSQDKTVMSGAVDKAHSEKICKMLDLAAKNGVPVIGIYDSCGAYVNDGADALNAYSDILLNMGNISGVVPVISVISGVCAGTMAMIASSADFSVMTADAEYYTEASQPVTDAQSAAACGAVSCTAESDSEAMDIVRKYLSMMPQNNLSPAPEFDYAAPSSASFEDAAAAAASVADEDSILEISAAYGKASYTALCTVGGMCVGFAAVNKTADKLTADDCAKLSRFVRICDAYSVPVVTVVDTDGFDLSSAAAVRSLAGLSGAYADATCPKIALISGKACGTAFITFAGKNAAADAVYALAEAVIAPVDTLTAAEFLYHDRLKGAADLDAERKAVAAEYAQNEASAFAAAEKGAVDDIFTADEARSKIISALEISAGKRLNKKLPKKHSVLPL